MAHSIRMYIHTYVSTTETHYHKLQCMYDRSARWPLQLRAFPVRQEVGLGVALTCSTERNSDGAGARSLWMM